MQIWIRNQYLDPGIPAVPSPLVVVFMWQVKGMKCTSTCCTDKPRMKGIQEVYQM